MNKQIGQILLKFKNEVDLNKKVLTFFSPSLIKLHKISEKIDKKEVSFESNLAFDQIVQKDLPKLLDSYLTLPIETRHTDIVDKYDDSKQTAFDILIQSLSMVTNKVDTLWDDVLENDKKNLLVRKKTLEYTSENDGSLLAAEFEKEEEDYSINVDKEIKKLMREAEGNWQNGFNKSTLHKQTSEENINTEKGLSPPTFFVITGLLFTILTIVFFIT